MNAIELERLCRRELDVTNIKLGPNGWFRMCCPLHSEMNPSFGIYSAADYHPYLCYVCGKGSLLTLVKQVRGLSTKDALELIKSYGTYGEYDSSRMCEVLPAYDERLENPKKRRPLEFKGNGFSIVGMPLLASFEGRNLDLIESKTGIDKAHLKRCRIGFDKEDRRIIYPWIYGGQLFGMTGRTVSNDPNVPKTMPYYGFQKGTILYLPLGKIRSDMPLCLVEGEKSAAYTSQVYPNVAAIGSTTMSKAQADMISDNCDSVIWFPDPDDGGDNMIRQGLPYLLGKVQNYWAQARPGKDPADHSLPALRNVLKFNNLKLILTREGDMV